MKKEEIIEMINFNEIHTVYMPHGIYLPFDSSESFSDKGRYVTAKEKKLLNIINFLLDQNITFNVYSSYEFLIDIIVTYESSDEVITFDGNTNDFKNFVLNDYSYEKLKILRLLNNV